jgi:hypothetical protein
MSLNVTREVASLQRMTIAQLRQRYAEVFRETTNVNNRTWIIKRIAWRLQALAEGDLSERARQRAAELANDADLRLNPPRSLPLLAAEPIPESETVVLPFAADGRLPSTAFRVMCYWVTLRFGVPSEGGERQRCGRVCPSVEPAVYVASASF